MANEFPVETRLCLSQPLDVALNKGSTPRAQLRVTRSFYLSSSVYVA